jgi:hypothetical protein
MAQVRAATAPAQKSLEQFATATAGAAKAAEQSAASVKRLGDTAKPASQSTQSLVQTTQGLTQSLLGANVASIALGAAIGGILQAAVMETVRALITATTQLADMHNELLLVAGVGGRAAESLQTIQAAAAASGDTFGRTAQQYQALIAEFRGTTVPLERVNDLFLEQQRRLGELRLVTPVSAWTTMIESAGQALARFFGLIPRGLDVAIDRSLTLQQLQTRERELQRSILGIQGQRLNAGRESLTVEERTRPLLDQQEAVRRRIAELRVDEGFAALRSEAITNRLNMTLEHELSVARMTTNEAEIQNRLFQIRLQFLQAGVTLSADQLRLFEQQLRTIQSVTLGMRDQAAAAQNAVTALSGIPTNFGNIFLGQFDVMRSGMNAWTQEVTTVHTPAFQEAMRLQEEAMRHAGATNAEVFAMRRSLALQEQRLAMDTASMLASTITAIFPKQKGAAIAAAVINTAVAVTRALQLPWPFNWAQAALVAASGAAQIASIQSASPAGGSTAPVSGGGSTGGGSAATGAMPTRIFIEGVDPAAIFTGAQLNGLIDAINNQAENGRIVVANKLV